MRSQILRGLLRGDDAQAPPKTMAEGMAPKAFPPGIEITGKDEGGDMLGGGDPMEMAANQVRTGLEALAAEYPEAQTILQQFEDQYATWMGGGPEAAAPVTEEPLPEEVPPAV